jgi:Spy/CpxP family protein refolding chaperone
MLTRKVFLAVWMVVATAAIVTAVTVTFMPQAADAGPKPDGGGGC